MAEVTISLEEYKHLIETASKHEMIVGAVFDAATLNYNCERLAFLADPLDNSLKVLEHDTYMARLHELQAKEEEE